MGVIVDTSIWVDLERKRLGAADLEAIVGDEPVFVTPVTIAELEYGLARALTEAQRERRAAALALVKAGPCLPITDATGEVFGRVAAQLDQKGRPAKHRAQDLWIASLALQHGLKVLTQNRSDFEDIPGLTILSPPPPPREP
jgi:predicted nucleic acid-binding protein